MAIELETALFTPGTLRTADMPASTAGPSDVANWIVKVETAAAVVGVGAAIGVAAGPSTLVGTATGPAVAKVCSISFGSISAAMLSVGSGLRMPETSACV